MPRQHKVSWGTACLMKSRKTNENKSEQKRSEKQDKFGLQSGVSQRADLAALEEQKIEKRERSCLGEAELAISTTDMGSNICWIFKLRREMLEIPRGEGGRAYSTETRVKKKWSWSPRISLKKT